MSFTGMSFGQFFQNAYVTRDLARAETLIGQRHGLTDWVHFEPEMEVWTATDGHGSVHLKVALGWVGAYQVELIEPVSGNMRHYIDYLPPSPDDASPRLHHICMRVADYGETRAVATARGWPIAYEGGVEGCKFLYLDARESLGHYVEYMWMSDAMWAGSGGPPDLAGARWK